MSAPATKARSPAPSRITARTEESAAIASRCDSNSCMSGVESALSLSGRLKVSRAMPGSTASLRIRFVMALSLDCARRQARYELALEEEEDGDHRQGNEHRACHEFS